MVHCQNICVIAFISSTPILYVIIIYLSRNEEYKDLVYNVG